MTPSPSRRWRIGGEALFGLGLAALGVLIALDVQSLKVAPIYAKVGPKVFPLLIAGGLIVLGLLTAFFSARVKTATEETPQSELWPVVLISVGLLVQVFALKPVGFILSALFLFLCVAAAFGGRRWFRLAAVGLTLAVIIHVGFTYGLDLALPLGILEGVL